MGRGIRERLVLLLGSLVKQMVGSSNIIVAIRFDALNRVVRVKAELIENLFVDSIVDWHDLLSWEQALRLLVLELLVPRMRPYLLYRVSSIRVSLQNFTDEVTAVS